MCHPVATRHQPSAIGDGFATRSTRSSSRLLESKAIQPSPRPTGGRSSAGLSLDLIGLPPTLARGRALRDDADPRAYERQVDRLLDSPHYGERMAVPWLDLARFADTVGYHGDQGQHIFPYRDYVIDAFNANKPFDQFTVEQLAGDLLPHPTVDQLVATGFNRLNMMTREGGAQPGSISPSMPPTACAPWRLPGSARPWAARVPRPQVRPFTQRDFYSLAAFFADVKQWGVYADYGYTPNPELKRLDQRLPVPSRDRGGKPLSRSIGKSSCASRSMQFCCEAVPQAAGATATASFIRLTGSRTAAAFIKTAPSGWITPTAHS